MANWFDKGTRFDIPSHLKWLSRDMAARAQEAAPSFPQRQVADLDPLERTAYDQARDYTNSGPSDAYSTALAETMKTATQPVDVTSMPDYQAVVSQIAQYGQGEANRLQRGNILNGNASWRSSAGANALGTSVAETQERMMSASSAFLQQARKDKQNAVNQLAYLDTQGQNTQLSKINTGSRVGEILRGIEGAKLEAEYQNQMDPINFRYVTQPQIAGAANSAPYTAAETTSENEKYATGIASVLKIIASILAL